MSKLIECLSVLPVVQSAYRQKYLTETPELKITLDVFKTADNGHVTLLAMLDLSAAFNTVDHVTLLSRLERSYGIGGTVLK